MNFLGAIFVALAILAFTESASAECGGLTDQECQEFCSTNGFTEYTCSDKCHCGSSSAGGPCGGLPQDACDEFCKSNGFSQTICGAEKCSCA